MITILTPTYNREKTLKRLYDSLVLQTNKNFEWLVVDDGSIDNTKNLINKFKDEKKIKVRYIYKANGGKHTALNVGTAKAKGELILILDSDDYLNGNAIELVYKYWDKYKNYPNICGVVLLKKIGNPIYREKSFEECIANLNEFKYNRGILSDMCEVIKTDILKQYPYPVFKNEKFLSEVIVIGEIAKKYDMAYVPIEIYNAEYLEDGLSKNWFRLVVNNPLGARANNLLFMSKEFRYIIRLKNCIMFDVFSIIAKKSIIRENKMKIWGIIFLFPCYFIAKILEYKYKNK